MSVIAESTILYPVYQNVISLAFLDLTIYDSLLEKERSCQGALSWGPFCGVLGVQILPFSLFGVDAQKVSNRLSYFFHIKNKNIIITNCLLFFLDFSSFLNNCSKRIWIERWSNFFFYIYIQGHLKDVFYVFQYDFTVLDTFLFQNPLNIGWFWKSFHMAFSALSRLPRIR